MQSKADVRRFNLFAIAAYGMSPKSDVGSGLPPASGTNCLNSVEIKIVFAKLMSRVTVIRGFSLPCIEIEKFVGNSHACEDPEKQKAHCLAPSYQPHCADA
jgi:hypothetical protein